MSLNTWLKAGESLVIDGKTALIINKGQRGVNIEIVDLSGDKAHRFEKERIVIQKTK